MTTSSPGFVRPDGDRRAVRFARRYKASPEAVWAALTDPAELSVWLATASFEPHEGGRVHLDFGEDGSAHGHVRVFEPPRVLEYEWRFTGEDESVVRWELTPDGDGTLLVLDHRLLAPDHGPMYGAGWQAHLDALHDLLHGTVADDRPWNERYDGYLPAYSR